MLNCEKPSILIQILLVRWFLMNILALSLSFCSASFIFGAIFDSNEECCAKWQRRDTLQKRCFPARWSKDRYRRSDVSLVSLRHDRLTSISPQNLHHWSQVVDPAFIFPQMHLLFVCLCQLFQSRWNIQKFQTHCASTKAINQTAVWLLIH